MSRNAETGITEAWRLATAHSPHSVRAGGHALDWENKPFPFKVYPGAASVALPRELDVLALDAVEAVAGDVPDAQKGPVGLARLATLLYFSAGVTRVKRYSGGGEIHFRAAPSTGALYQTEVYVIAGEVDGLEPGVYHFSPGDFCLRRLVTGDARAVLAGACADSSLTGSAAALVLSGIFWRNAWKYRARAWRHLYWDAGSMLAHVLAVGGSLGLRPKILTGFIDADLDRLLGLDSSREAALVVVGLGGAGTQAGEDIPVPSEATRADPGLAVVPLSASEVDYPEIRAMQAVSALEDPDEVQGWRRPDAPPRRPTAGEVLALPAPRGSVGRTLGETVARRASSRRFRRDPLTAEQLSTALALAAAPVASDVTLAHVDLYLSVHAVDGVAPGAYRYRPSARGPRGPSAREPRGPGTHGLELLRLGEFRAESAFLCLEQDLGGDAAATVYFFAPLAAVLAAYGNRGWRLANLEAGLRGGRLYLAAYAQAFGATGLTFYDADAARFFGTDLRGDVPVFVTALGRGALP